MDKTRIKVRAILLAVSASLLILSCGVGYAATNSDNEELRMSIEQPDNSTFKNQSNDLAAPEQRGCCSWHGGVCGCEDGRAKCCDGTLSPSCGC